MEDFVLFILLHKCGHNSIFNKIHFLQKLNNPQIHLSSQQLTQKNFSQLEHLFTQIFSFLQKIKSHEGQLI